MMEEKGKILIIGDTTDYSGVGKIDKRKSIVIVGAGMIVVIEDNKRDIPTIELNGVKYQRIEHKKPKSGKFGRAAAMSAALTPTRDFGGSDYVRKRPKVDLIQEYGLIELKQSKLCRADRDWVVWQFEHNYKKL